MKLGSDPPSRLVLTRLERAVIEALASRLGAAGAALRAQCERLQVTSRTHSGVGFVTRLEVPADAPAVTGEAAARAGTVNASHPELREPAEFVVQLKGGRLATIEAFCGEGMWPADDSRFRVL